MKKILLQICSVLFLALAFGSIAANAQSINKYGAHVPFNFQVGGKNYKSGNYLIVLNLNPSLESGVLMLTDEKNRCIWKRIFIANKNASKNDTANLLFVKTNNLYALTDLVSSEFGIKITNRQAEAKIVPLDKHQNIESQTAAILLSKK